MRRGRPGSLAEPPTTVGGAEGIVGVAEPPGAVPEALEHWSPEWGEEGSVLSSDLTMVACAQREEFRQCTSGGT